MTMMPHRFDNLPFRMGTTSFIYPGSWISNVERLADRCSDVEILFFEAHGPNSLPSMPERRTLAAIKPPLSKISTSRWLSSWSPLSSWSR